ncbi:TetR/AcrR family transcriptional regulator [Nocardia terpenica]|uniref:TetR family transcriptional regulator n=1 Tax=Nocardia terpenica TaxID=455432 RepID=A0A161WQT5_9NOCA|nr:TetR/AcrR family transcriptional regulator [Nocardia terpenica]KZM75695.1 TetR family transcriptional regulator [Nocardia terpenica]NQE86202.1 TetR/AcrR family transcriptional regulator [Nocardia terpenica]
MSEAVLHTLIANLIAPDAELIAQLDNDDAVTTRILAAAYEQAATVGWRRSTIDDVARRARLGRATVYRRFSTKQELSDAVVLNEVRKYLAGSTAAVSAQSTVEDRIAESTAYTVEFLRNHRLLRRLLETEPETILPSLTTEADPLLDLAREFCVSVWRRELYGDKPIPGDRLQHLHTVAELHIRMTLSFILTSRSTIPLDTPDQARHFARTYLAPMLELG